MLNRTEEKHKDDISAACFKELQSCGLLKNYSLWQTKYAGCLEGVKLKGASKTGEPKTTYTKKFRVHAKNRNTELTEFIALCALQACGIPTPKAKIKVVNDCTFYQFARDISECHKTAANPAPLFYTLFELTNKTCPFQLGKDKITVEFTPAGTTATKSIVIDKNSLAKLTVAATIFNLVDLHSDNVGLIIDVKAGTAKLAVVDLQLRTLSADGPEYKKHTSLASLIRGYKPIKEDFDAACLSQLDDGDFLKALDELTASMKNACDEAKKAAIRCNLSPWLDDDYIGTLINAWQTNHDELQFFTLMNRAPLQSCKK